MRINARSTVTTSAPAEHSSSRKLRIALVGYEFPPETAFAGIATYARDAVDALQATGHQVDVFCGGEQDASRIDPSGACIHQVGGARDAFPSRVLAVFTAVHTVRLFDVLEGPDYHAEAWRIRQAFPTLPYVVKLHTPDYLVARLNRRARTREQILAPWRRVWYQIRTNKTPEWPWRGDPIHSIEKANAHSAALIAAPSQAIARRLTGAWSLDASRLTTFPLPFRPDPRLLALPLENRPLTVAYIGRLEFRKGVDVLGRALPALWQAQPNTRVRLIGADRPSHIAGLSMSAYLRRCAGSRADKLEFLGKVDRARLPELLGDVAVCVFPSRWESFGLVVLEAIAAGCAVVCPAETGMAELVGNGAQGRLVPAGSAPALATATAALLGDAAGRIALAARARTEALPRYDPAIVAALQARSYALAMTKGNPQA